VDGAAEGDELIDARLAHLRTGHLRRRHERIVGAVECDPFP
jgi:hypothetical protein